VQELGARLAELVASGDLEAARTVSDAIAKLLGAEGAAARVLDIGTERRRRGKE